MKVILDIFEGDATLNSFMHSCDVFKKGKQLANGCQLEIEGEPNVDKLTDTIKSAFEQNKRNVVFISVREVDGKLVNHYPQYLKSGVQTISDGQKFGLFKDMLAQIGYEVKTNKHVVVEEAKLIL